MIYLWLSILHMEHHYCKQQTEGFLEKRHILCLIVYCVPAHPLDTAGLLGLLSCTESWLHSQVYCRQFLHYIRRRPAVFPVLLGTLSSPFGCRPRPHPSVLGGPVDQVAQTDQPLPRSPCRYLCRPCPVLPVLLGLNGHLFPGACGGWASLRLLHRCQPVFAIETWHCLQERQGQVCKNDRSKKYNAVLSKLDCT